MEPQEYLESVTLCNDKQWEQVREKTVDAQSKMKRYYDRGAVRIDIKEGDWVLLKKQPHSNTLSPLYEGSWIVAKRRGSNVHLRNHESGTVRVVHVNKCKKMPHFG